LQWLFANHQGARWTRKTAAAAVRHGHLAVLERVLPHVEDNALRGQLLGDAAWYGQLEIVTFLFKQTRQLEPALRGRCRQLALTHAICRSHVHVAKYLLSEDASIKSAPSRAVSCSCRNGELEAIKWFYANPLAGSSGNVIDAAAISGHLHVVEWIHANVKTQQASMYAMNGAAKAGHL
ncbi:Ankyrin repeat-containing protein, partial [Globisporangium polare]